jgi:hypothetical protein
MPHPDIREHLRWRGPWIVFLLSLRELLRPRFDWYVWRVYETDLSHEIPRPYSHPIFDVVIYTSLFTPPETTSLPSCLSFSP